MGGAQLGQNHVTPLRPGPRQQQLAAFGHVAQGAVVGQHRRAVSTLHALQALVHGVHIAQASGCCGICRVCAVNHVVPTGGRTGVVLQWRFDVEVGHQPGCIAGASRGKAQPVRRAFKHPCGDKDRQRHNAALSDPAMGCLRRGIERIHLNAVTGAGNAHHHLTGLQARFER